MSLEDQFNHLEDRERRQLERMSRMNKQMQFQADMWAEMSVFGGLVFAGAMIFVACSLKQ